jgi:hypothetical protein
MVPRKNLKGATDTQIGLGDQRLLPGFLPGETLSGRRPPVAGYLPPLGGIIPDCVICWACLGVVDAPETGRPW